VARISPSTLASDGATWRDNLSFLSRIHGRNAEHRRQLTGAREPPSLLVGAKCGLNLNYQDLAFQPLNAGLKSLKIGISVTGLVGTMSRDCILVLAIGRQRGSKVICVGVQGTGRISQRRDHAQILPPGYPLIDVPPPAR
jgi:hypothetical protein